MSQNKKKISKKSDSKNQNVVFLIELSASIIFALLSINFSADISLLAFPISLIFVGITVYFTYFKMLKNKDGRKCFCVLKLIQYLPFVLLLTFILRRAGNNGTAFWYDLITVIDWCVIFVLSLVISYKMNDKRIKTFTSGWDNPLEKYNKPKGGARVLFEIVDWIDALVQAIFIVLLFQIFVLQLYEIPSESMVPTFLIKDRVAVSKLDCGPKFPLTDVGLPDFRHYKKGDTIVLRNPHYKMDRKSEVKTVTSQLIYMLTFMTVNLNKDENGELKADPLVKRIAAEPGEQIVMQDGVLYYRTKNSDVWQPSIMDAKYATWNLNSINSNLKSRVETFPLSSKDYENMIDFEDERKAYDLDAAVFNAQELVRKFNDLAFKDNLSGTFSLENLNEYDLFSKFDDVTRRLMCQNGGVEWFDSFMTSWIPSKSTIKDMYAESNYRLNVMSKITFGNIVVRCAQLLREGADNSVIANDAVIISEMQKAEMLNSYIQEWLDERNMPVFPANDENGNPQYIPNNCYFMMGDNRFNSLDLRHAKDYSLKALSKYDNQSIEYWSIIDPVYINKKYIIGKPTFRFWPTDRMGRVR